MSKAWVKMHRTSRIGLSRTIATSIAMVLSFCLLASLWAVTVAPARAIAAPLADLSETFSRFSVSDIQSIGKLRNAAFSATQSDNFTEAETQWSALIKQLPGEAAVWSNRGNVRVRQNNLEGALADYTQAIASSHSPSPPSALPRLL